MNRALSILDANDLTGVEGVKRFLNDRDAKAVKTFVEAMQQAIRDDAHSEPTVASSLDDVNFLPSSSLRGDSGCGHWDCRLPKARTLARYAALYCDKAVVPVRLDFGGKGANHSQEVIDRYFLGGRILQIIELRPLIEAGIAALIPDQVALCKRHWNEAVPEHRKIIRTAQLMANRNASRFSVRFTPAKGHVGPGFEFTGPEEYLEHGSLHTVLDATPPWLATRKISGSIELSKTIVRRQKLVFRFFLQIANDALLQTYFGSAFNARYVTDMEGEAEFFKLLNEKDELAIQTAALCARLAHCVPMMTEIPISVILRLRRDEPEAFQNYRTALTGIVKNYVVKGRSVNDTEAREIYLDLLKPEIDALQAKAKNIRQAQTKSGLLKAVASSALIGLGIYGGVLPSHLGDLIKTIGGFNVAKDLVETLAAITRDPTEVRNHNLYFLLRLKRQQN